MRTLSATEVIVRLITAGAALLLVGFLSGVLVGQASALVDKMDEMVETTGAMCLNIGATDDMASRFLESLDNYGGRE